MDVFQKRIVEQDAYLKDVIDSYLDCGKNTDHHISQTTLTYLVLSTNTVFNDQEYRLMLNLNYTTEARQLYDTILQNIRFHSLELYSFYHYPSLLCLPLTNIKDISYQIGLHFTEIFFAPTTVNIVDEDPPLHNNNNGPHTIGVIKFISRFNEMWIITSLLNREYLQLV